MTFKGIALAAALLAASEPTSAAACHRYSVWRYPWPQSCGVSSTIARQAARRAPKVGHNDVVAKNPPAMPLPSLAQADLAGGEADEPTRARVLLRAALEAAHAH